VLECGIEIVGQNDINADDIEEVTIFVHPGASPFLNQPFKMGDSQQKALFNYCYGAANVLLRKYPKLEHYTENAIRDPKVIALAGRVKVVPIQQNATGVELRVKMKDGREFSASRNAPARGMASNRLTRQEILDKFWANIDFSNTVSRKNSEKAINMLENLENVDSVSEIVKLLVV
jgi:2-methylcitrate dehydratase PrpD